MMATIPKSGTQVSAPTEPINAKPHVLLLKANAPPIKLINIQKINTTTIIAGITILSPNPMSRIT
jgi:hypothetical protein